MKKLKSIEMKPNTNSLWHESVQYLKGTRIYIYIIVFVFFLSSLIGYIFPESFTFFNSLLEELASIVEGKSAIELIWFIFQNNVKSAFFGMIFGFVGGIVPIVNAVTNGTVLGYVYALVSAEEGLAVIWYLLPHGVFELPAIFIALGLGVRFGMFVFTHNRKKEFIERFYGSMKVFFTIVLPLLIVAAVIEGILIALS